MWTRSDLKAQARAALRHSYWAAVAICFLLAFIGAEYADSAILIHQNSDAMTTYTMVVDGSSGILQLIPEDGAQSPAGRWAVGVLNSLFAAQSWLLRLGLGGLIALSGLAVLLFQFFVCQPVSVGARCFFLKAHVEKANMLEVTAVLHRTRYFRVVWVMLCRWVFTYLWSLLLIVPGIVKHYQYYMVPYLLADRPDLTRREVFEMSRHMMHGEKWRVFVLDLSFWPWMLLTALSFGLVGIFYVNPYRAATGAGLYHTLARGPRGVAG